MTEPNAIRFSFDELHPRNSVELILSVENLELPADIAASDGYEGEFNGHIHFTYDVERDARAYEISHMYSFHIPLKGVGMEYRNSVRRLFGTRIYNTIYGYDALWRQYAANDDLREEYVDNKYLETLEALNDAGYAGSEYASGVFHRLVRGSVFY